jgi:hypothetical protein
MQVVVPSVSRAAVLQGTALTVFVETPSGATLSKPGPVSISGKAFGCEAGAAPGAGADAPVPPLDVSVCASAAEPRTANTTAIKRLAARMKASTQMPTIDEQCSGCSVFRQSQSLSCVTRPAIPLATRQRASPQAFTFAWIQSGLAGSPRGRLTSTAARKSEFRRASG